MRKPLCALLMLSCAMATQAAQSRKVVVDPPCTVGGDFWDGHVTFLGPQGYTRTRIRIQTADFVFDTHKTAMVADLDKFVAVGSVKSVDSGYIFTVEGPTMPGHAYKVLIHGTNCLKTEVSYTVEMLPPEP